MFQKQVFLNVLLMNINFPQCIAQNITVKQFTDSGETAPGCQKTQEYK